MPNGVNLERFDHPAPLEEGSEVAEVFEQYRDKFKVVYTGAHGVPNGLDVIVEAARLIQEKSENIHFILIGEGTEKSRLKEKTQSLELTNITFCEPIPKQAIPSALLAADCLVYSIPAFNIYRFGVSLNKSFDYLASVKPVVMAGNPQNNIVEEANAGIVVEPENPEALAEAIIGISQLPKEKREELGKNGRRYVEQHHSTKILAEKLEALLGWNGNTGSSL